MAAAKEGSALERPAGRECKAHRANEPDAVNGCAHLGRAGGGGADRKGKSRPAIWAPDETQAGYDGAAVVPQLPPGGGVTAGIQNEGEAVGCQLVKDARRVNVESAGVRSNEEDGCVRRPQRARVERDGVVCPR